MPHRRPLKASRGDNMKSYDELLEDNEQLRKDNKELVRINQEQQTKINNNMITLVDLVNKINETQG